MILELYSDESIAIVKYVNCAHIQCIRKVTLYVRKHRKRVIAISYNIPRCSTDTILLEMDLQSETSAL